MLDAIAAGRVEGIDVIVFPEMAIPGYIIGDTWDRPAFLRECEECGIALRDAAQSIVCVFGNVGIDWNRRNEDGRVRKYNALFVAENGRFVGPAECPYPFVIKTLLPNYREFDDSRHFFDLRKLALEERRPVDELIAPVLTQHASLGCTLCEDAWDIDYSISPLNILAHKRADVFINISASPYTVNKNHKRNRVFSAHAEKIGRPLLYVNHVGIQNNGKTVYTFDGSSCVYDGCGGCIECGNIFEENTLTCDLPIKTPARIGPNVSLCEDTIETVCRALLYGTRKFMELCGVERVAVGISGGIDSSVVASLYRRLLEPENLLVVNMPGRFNSQTTRDLAAELAAKLGCFYAEVPIEDSVSLTLSQVDGIELSTVAGDKKERIAISPLALENIQARDRSSRILAAISNAFGGVFTCNANKSELVVGYATFYGDTCGYLANLADLWKTEIYELARHLNEIVYGEEIIPTGSFDLVPSAELSNAHNVDEGQGDPLIYPYHDTLFRSWVEAWNRTTPEDILEWRLEGTLEDRLGYKGSLNEVFSTAAEFVDDLERWWKLYQGIGLAKRIQAPPVLGIKKRVFGFDHREAQMNPHFTPRYDMLKKTVLMEGN